MAKIDVLAMVRDLARYREKLSAYEPLDVVFVPDTGEAFVLLGKQHFDVCVVDQQLDDTHQMIETLRSSYPRLLVILVDEEADFGLPGIADEMSTNPFEGDDLYNRVEKLMSDRRMETLRSDSLPAVRSISKQITSASGTLGKQTAAVEVCVGLDYDYTAYYQIESEQPITLKLRAQAGSKAIQAIAPKEASSADLMGWVAENAQTRIAGPEDRPNHPLVERGRLGAVACVPVQWSERVYGVLAVCRDRPDSIAQDHILMLEMVGTQLAMALAKEHNG